MPALSWGLRSLVLVPFTWSGLVLPTVNIPQVQAQTDSAVPSGSEATLQIGIIQRFGEKGATDVMTLQALPGDQLTVRISDGKGKTQTLQTPSLKLEIAMQPLPKPRVEERVVFSNHRSFEIAEEKAMEWRQRGIEVELAQPGRWQVWAKRSVYKTPTVRRLLLQSLQQQGFQTAQIDTQTLKTLPRATFMIGQFKYTRDRIDISAGQGMVVVDRDKDDIPKGTFPGSLRLQTNAYGTYSLVNFVPMEAYLRGVVPYEIGRGAPQSAMEAQAVLARTYALRNLRRFAIDNYQLCATTQCQVYYGITGASESTDRAIMKTRGQVLTYNNELVDAVYSSTTGGVTAPFHEVWKGAERPYLTGKVDAITGLWNLEKRSLADETNLRDFLAITKGFNESDESNWFRWKTEASLGNLVQDLQKYLKSIRHPLANFKTIQELQVMERSYAGRVKKLGVQTDLGVVVLERDDVLLAFEAPNSMLFYLNPILAADSKTLTGYAFVGGGLGHAVGLSQYGSYHLGRQGWSYDRILAFYFPGAQLRSFNSSITLWREPTLSPTR
ncbi:MAG: SpoIID/LytB domain-containing protein [Synechococcales bacterium]|nr:SpoIID/LytB domain-containing protein [Synechococcales bacterium]